MNCPSGHAGLTFISGDTPTGVVAPDGGREVRYGEGYYCERCDRIYDPSDVEVPTTVAREEQIQRWSKAARRLLELIAKCHIEDPGESDLYDEQPATCHLTLKEVRLARRLLREP